MNARNRHAMKHAIDTQCARNRHAMKHAIGGLCLVASGCGAAQVSLETARIAACEEAEAHVERSVDDGRIERDEGFERIDCIRLACDMMHEKIRSEP